jgi:hypothetical protein
MIRRCRVAGAAAVVAGLSAWLHAPPARAGLPEWAKAVAQSAPEIPEGMPEWPSRTLLWERHVIVSPDGTTWKIEDRKAEQYLSNRVDDTAFHFFAYDDTTKVKRSKGWHLPPGARAHRDVAGTIDVAVSDTFLTDTKARAIALEGVKKGSLVFYEIEAEAKPYTLATRESFYDDVPVAAARYVVDLPPGWSLRHAWLPSGGPEPARSGSTWTFELKDLNPVKSERLGPDPISAAPELVVGLVPPGGVAPATPALRDWNDLGRWWWSIAKGRDAGAPPLQKAADEAASKAGGGALERIRAVALYVRDRVRYLDREVGVGGYQPRPAAQVFNELYGDCKDKGTLLRAMLAAEGYTSYPMLVKASRPDTVAEGVPDLGAFDHFVVGVVWPKDAPEPKELASSLVDVPGAGRLFVIDATDEYAWPGTLPAHLAGRRALVVTPDAAVLVALPAGDPATHCIAKTVVTTLGSGGTASVRVEVKSYGAPAEVARVEYARSAVDRRKSAEDDARRAWPGATVKDYAVTAESSDGAYTETLGLDLPAGSSGVQDGVIALFASALQDSARVSLTKRTVPVVYRGPLGLRYDATLNGVPATAETPTPEQIAGDGWSVASSFDKKGDAIHGTWRFDRARARFEPASFPELKQMWAAASKAASSAIRVGP